MNQTLLISAFLLSLSGCSYYEDKLGNVSIPPKGSSQTTAENPSEKAHAPVTFSWVKANILRPNCAICHFGEDAVFDLSSVAAILDAGVLTPGDPKRSTIYTILTDPDPKSRMPKGRAQLPQELINQLGEWIANGAKND